MHLVYFFVVWSIKHVFLDPFNMQTRLDVVEQINSIFMYIQVINKTRIEKQPYTWETTRTKGARCWKRGVNIDRDRLSLPLLMTMMEIKKSNEYIQSRYRSAFIRRRNRVTALEQKNNEINAEYSWVPLRYVNAQSLLIDVQPHSESPWERRLQQPC